MIRALVWKEARDQGLIVAALAVLGAAVLVAVGLLNPAAGGSRTAQQVFVDPGFLALVALTVTAGTVVGGTLFAGEKEAGTFAYLVSLPVPRWKVWAGKICGGAVLVVAMLIGPPATAYLLTDRLDRMLLYGVLIGVASSVCGYILAAMLDGSVAAAIAVMSGVFFLLALFFSPTHGIVTRKLRNRVDQAEVPGASGPAVDPARG